MSDAVEKPKMIDIYIGEEYYGKVDAKKFVEMIKLVATEATDAEKKAKREARAKNQKGKSVGKKGR